nr:TPA_asm: hypothetical protein [Bos-associated insect adintovirus 2]
MLRHLTRCSYQLARQRGQQQPRTELPPYVGVPPPPRPPPPQQDDQPPPQPLQTEAREQPNEEECWDNSNYPTYAPMPRYVPPPWFSKKQKQEWRRLQGVHYKQDQYQS